MYLRRKVLHMRISIIVCGSAPSLDSTLQNTVGPSPPEPSRTPPGHSIPGESPATVSYHGSQLERRSWPPSSKLRTTAEVWLCSTMRSSSTLTRCLKTSGDQPQNPSASFYRD